MPKTKTPSEIVGKNTILAGADVQRLAIALFLADCAEIATLLEPDDFQSETYRNIFVACKEYHRVMGGTDIIGVHHSLNGKRWYEQLGGSVFLLGHFMLPAHVHPHMAEVMKTVKMLKEIRARQDVEGISSLLDDFATGDVGDILHELQSKAKDALQHLPSTSSISIKDMAKALKDRQVPKVPTGFARMDEALNGGIADGTLFVIAARPSIGKTSLALNIAANCAQAGKRVLFTSLEMSREDIAERFMCGYMGATEKDVRQNAESLFPKIDGDFLIDDGARSLAGIRSVFSRNWEVDLFIIDYLQLISALGRDGKESSRINEMGRITRELKLLAMDMKKPVILLSQLSRAIEKDRNNREPVLSDLRDSGTIEQDADYVTFLWDKNSKKRDDNDIDDEEWGIDAAEKDIRWILRKNRYGPPNRSYKMDFKGEHYSFTHKPIGRKPDVKATI